MRVRAVRSQPAHHPGEDAGRRPGRPTAHEVVALLALEVVAVAALAVVAVGGASTKERLALLGLVVVLVAGQAVVLTAWWKRRTAFSGAAAVDSAASAPADPAAPAAPAPVAGASELLVSLARRNQALLYRQLARLDELEAREQSPETLAGLFAVDHLATRMRRNAESLLVLSGEETTRRVSRPVAFSEAIRGAVAEIEDYERVDVTVQGEAELTGHAVVDVVHLLAELVDNAASFSPPDSRVSVHGARTRDGYSVTITDRGVGLDPEQVEHVNARLASWSDADDLEASSMLGLRVVRRLAARHEIGVRIVSQLEHGSVVTVDVPAGLLVSGLPEPATATPSPSEGPYSERVAAGALPAAGPLGHSRTFFPDGVVPAGYVPRVPAPEPVGARSAPVADVHPGPAEDELTPAADPAPDAYAPWDATVLDPGLDRRVPQDSLAPEMRDASPSLPSDGAEVPEPERARSLLAAYSTGLSMGRADIPDHPGAASLDEEAGA